MAGSTNGTKPIGLDVNAILAQHSEPIRIGDTDYMIRPIPAKAQHLLAQLADTANDPGQAKVICQAASMCLTPAITADALMDDSFAISLYVVQRARAGDEKLQRYLTALAIEDDAKNVGAASEAKPAPAPMTLSA